MSKDRKAHVGFGVKFSNDQNLYLRFEFNNSGLTNLFWGIMRESVSIKRNDSIWKQINEVMSTKFSSGSKPEERWPWWNWIANNKEFTQYGGNWNLS